MVARCILRIDPGAGGGLIMRILWTFTFELAHIECVIKALGSHKVATPIIHKAEMSSSTLEKRSLSRYPR